MLKIRSVSIDCYVMSLLLTRKWLFNRWLMYRTGVKFQSLASKNTLRKSV